MRRIFAESSPVRRRTSGCTGARAAEQSGFGQVDRAGPVNLDVRRLPMVDYRVYGLPIFRRFHRADSPNGAFWARIDPAYEVSMSDPTSGTLCVSNGLHLDRCNPSFLWSHDSRFLAVPQFYARWGVLRRQRLVLVDLVDRRAYASVASARYWEPLSFDPGRLVATADPLRTRRAVTFEVPADLGRLFLQRHVAWPETPSN